MIIWSIITWSPWTFVTPCHHYPKICVGVSHLPCVGWIKFHSRRLKFHLSSNSSSVDLDAMCIIRISIRIIIFIFSKYLWFFTKIQTFLGLTTIFSRFPSFATVYKFYHGFATVLPRILCFCHVFYQFSLDIFVSSFDGLSLSGTESADVTLSKREKKCNVLRFIYDR